jgi:hypothetical protein
VRAGFIGGCQLKATRLDRLLSAMISRAGYKVLSSLSLRKIIGTAVR